MVRVKPVPKYIDLAKLLDKKKSDKKKGKVQVTLKTYFKVDYRYSRPDPKVNLPKTAKPEIKMAHCNPKPSAVAPPDPPVLELPPPAVAPAPYVQSANFYQPSYLDDTEDELPEEDGDATRVVEGVDA